MRRGAVDNAAMGPRLLGDDTMSTPDIRFENHGSVMLVCPETQKGRRWLKSAASAESWQWLGQNLATEPRMAFAMALGASEDGLRLA